MFLAHSQTIIVVKKKTGPQYVGTSSTRGDGFTDHLEVTNGSAFCRAYTATSAGTLGKAYIRHYDNGTTENACVTVYLKNGSSPTSSDTLVGYSEMITTSAEGWVTDGADLGASVTVREYWVCIRGSTNSFDTYRSTAAGASVFSKGSMTCTTPNLDGTWTETANREYAVYVEIKP